jgi:alpha-mannosidase
VTQLTQRIGDRIWPISQPVPSLVVAGPLDRITYEQAQKLDRFRRAKIGDQFGPLWATFWFRGQATVPREWAGKRVDLQWASHSEATLWIDGKSRQGLNQEAGFRPSYARTDAILLDRARGGDKIEFQIEMACNRLFGSAEFPVKSISPFVLERCDIAVFDPLAWEIYYDLRTLVDLEAELSKDGSATDKAWAGELLYELNRFANLLDIDDQSTWKKAHAIVRKLYDRHNGTQTHQLSAIGHAHIDTAWLWPLAETDRKCERTFSTQTAYMNEYPDYKFACSQAYQYARIKERNPDLYKRIRAKVKAGQFVPVGGTWIEPDCNIPSGEALIRQFLYGQRFFENEFGIRCSEFWNPDVFGYNGQLPQIMNLAGIRRFLTQKLSWNKFNKPHHHTFTWQGIDGSEVLAHFPPADTYNAVATVAELRKNMRDYKDHDRSRHSMMLFGYGDGGGGPNRFMLESLRRAKDLQGLPRTTIRSSDEFFDLLEKDCADRPLMIGELYFEYHRGTYTTQSANKRDNRRSEFLLHDIEFLATIAHQKRVASPFSSKKKGTQLFSYPHAELDRLWKVVLLNQFHDILPGSSITLVYQDSKKHYDDVRRSGGALRDAAIHSLLGDGDQVVVVNTIGFDRSEVATPANGAPVYVEAPSYGIGRIVESPDRVSVSESANRIVLENAHLRATLSRGGQLVSLIEKTTNRESLAAAADLMVYDDTPTAWDAWDVDPFHLETEKPCPPADSCRIGRRSSLRAEVTFDRAIGKSSRMKQTVRLDANARRLEFHCDVDWHEERTMLKAVFPVNVRAMNATYEMQFGCVERPTHFNTSYDLARYEVPGHKWIDLSEHGFGVALLSESKYGFSTFGNAMRISLLRATTYPDPKADRGRHQFAYALMPHAGDWRDAGVVAEAYRFNVPVLIASAAEATEPHSFASVDDPNLVLDTIKRAEDDNSIILRLYECHGGRGTARIRIGLPFKKASYCNALEEELKSAKVRNGAIEVPYTPFQVISLKLQQTQATRRLSS